MPTKVFAVTSDNVTRKRISDGSDGAGSGNNKRMYVGDGSTYRYQTPLKFDNDWTDVGRIVSATLVVYTDDGLGRFPLASSSDEPKIKVRRLTSSFASGNNVDEDFDSSDYTNPTATTAGEKGATMAKADGAVNRIDITAIYGALAPKTVKRSDGTAGGGATNYGILLLKHTSGASYQWAGWSHHAADPSVRPTVELVYEYGLTAPNAPTNLSPSGAVATFTDFAGDFSDARAEDRLASSQVEVYDAAHAATAVAAGNTITSNSHGLLVGQAIYFTSLTGGVGLTTFTRYYVVEKTTNTFKVSATAGGAVVDITTDYTAMTWSRRVFAQGQKASNAEIVAARSSLIPSGFTYVAGRTYRWRLSHTDNQGQSGAWSGLTSFSVSNTAPNPPTLTPAGGSYASLNGVLFRGGTFSDPDAGDKLGAYQVQMAPDSLAEGDPGWEDADQRVWDTGKVLTPAGATSWEREYGGQSLAAGGYRLRARQWDHRGAVSSWAYTTLTLTADFEVEVGLEDSLQIDPRAPWRVVIKAMGANRGPGTVVAILENAKSVGGSKMYNSPGEVHFTLPPDHPQISVIEPKQTHYSVQFYSGDGWREKFAGVVWDFDATERDVVFTGIDYLALLQFVWDERFDPANPDKPASSGGSKYVDETIGYVVRDQLSRAIGLTNSPVGFITINQNLAAYEAMLTEHVTIWSTMQNVLNFSAGLIDSHRQGTGKNTRLYVRQKTGGGYEFVVVDDPGTAKDTMRLKYGELVQGYRVKAFGPNWASRSHTVGRTREGLKVMYKTETAPGIDESVWGRIAQPRIIEDISDENDLIRRTKQAAIQSSKLGQQIGVAIRSGSIRPLDGYDIGDHIPVTIQDGPIDTTAFGSGYWTCYGVAWEAGDNGSQNTILTLLPRNDTVAPDTDLLLNNPISPQPEWQIGWEAPDPLTATSRFWLDQDTGIRYERQDDGTYDPILTGVMDPPPTPTTPSAPTVSSSSISGVVKLKVVL